MYREKDRIRSEKWRKENKDRIKQYSVKKHLLKTYGMTLKQYDEMLQKQHFVCAICNLPEKIKEVRTGMTRRLSVDHCHKTNKIRGLLCSQCNTAIGSLKEDINIISNMLIYLNIKHIKLDLL